MPGLSRKFRDLPVDISTLGSPETLSLWRFELFLARYLWGLKTWHQSGCGINLKARTGSTLCCLISSQLKDVSLALNRIQKLPKTT